MVWTPKRTPPVLELSLISWGIHLDSKPGNYVPGPTSSTSSKSFDIPSRQQTPKANSIALAARVRSEPTGSVDGSAALAPRRRKKTWNTGWTHQSGESGERPSASESRIHVHVLCKINVSIYYLHIRIYCMYILYSYTYAYATYVYNNRIILE